MSIVNYNSSGLFLYDVDPAGDAGKRINDNFKALVDGTAVLKGLIVESNGTNVEIEADNATIDIYGYGLVQLRSTDNDVNLIAGGLLSLVAGAGSGFIYVGGTGVGGENAGGDGGANVTLAKNKIVVVSDNVWTDGGSVKIPA